MKDRILGEAQNTLTLLSIRKKTGTTGNSTNSNSQKEPKKAKKVASGEDDTSSVSRAASWMGTLACWDFKETWVQTNREASTTWWCSLEGGSGSADTQQKIDDSVQQKELERQCKKLNYS